MRGDGTEGAKAIEDQRKAKAAREAEKERERERDYTLKGWTAAAACQTGLPV